MNFKSFVVLVVSLFALNASASVKYSIDASHSRMGFKIAHLGISTVHGSFTKWEGQFSFDDKKKELTDLTAKVDTASIDTAEKKRDEHLRSPDFFNTAKYPTMDFKMTKAEKKSSSRGKVIGDLTLNGVTKPVTLDVEYKGPMTDPWGNQKLGFVATGKLNRKDFGIVWNKTLDKGGVMLGDTVDIVIDGEAQAEKPAAAK